MMSASAQSAKAPSGTCRRRRLQKIEFRANIYLFCSVCSLVSTSYMSRKTSSACSNISQATASTVVRRPVSLPILATKASNSLPCSSSHSPIIDMGYSPPALFDQAEIYYSRFRTATFNTKIGLSICATVFRVVQVRQHSHGRAHKTACLSVFPSVTLCWVQRLLGPEINALKDYRKPVKPIRKTNGRH